MPDSIRNAEKIIIADAHGIMRSGLCSYLQGEGYDVLAQVKDFVELIDAVKQHPANIVVADASMSGAGPVNFMHVIKRHHAELKVFFLTGLNSELLFTQLLAMGASGLISKSTGMSEVLEAVSYSETGGQYVSESFYININLSERVLSAKEFQLLELIVQGKSNKEMAAFLNKSPSTINVQRVNIMKKLNVHSVVELVEFCRDNGFFEI